MLRLFISLLPDTSTPEAGRVEVELNPERFLSVVIQTGGGEIQLTEADDGSLHLQTSSGGFVLRPHNTNSLDVGIQPFGGRRAGRRRFDRDSATSNRP